MNNKALINKLYKYNNLSKEEFLFLLDNLVDDDVNELISKADKVRKKIYGNKVYLRGLIEFTNYCKMNCEYCGIRRDNKNAVRYRLSKEQILDCARKGDKLGYKTFVLQGGEDLYYSDEILEDIIRSIKSEFPNNAITLSVGERSYESYKRLYEAGADRYLLRHETATKELYMKLHPGASFENR